MKTLPNQFQQFGSAAQGGKIITNQYGFDEHFVYEKIGRTILSASITDAEYSRLCMMYHNDFVGPQSIFAEAYRRENP